MTKIIHITPRKIATILCVIIFCLFAVNMAIIYLHFVQGHEHLKGFVRGFYFDAEANFLLYILPLRSFYAVYCYG